jgi:hypothetical protein
MAGSNSSLNPLIACILKPVALLDLGRDRHLNYPTRTAYAMA